MSIYQAVIAFRPLQSPPCFKSWIIANRCHVESTPGCRRRLCKSWSLPLGRSCQGSEKPGCPPYCCGHRRWGKGELSFCCVLRVSVSKTVLAKWGHPSAFNISVWCAPVLAELRIWPAVFTGNRAVVCLPAGFERGPCHCSWGEAGHRPGKIVTNQAILQDCPYSKVILFLAWNENGILRYI